MNERIKQFAEQSRLISDGEHWFSAIQESDVRSIDLERFAELVRQDEREACARLCDNLSEGLVGDDVDGAWGAGHCANAIRAKEQA